ncbi:alpha-amylase [Clostridium polyendosporum]|uniref:Alpha-amylase n=1 Tax=Clostridium polyendosporum TaxID=69208 RepID=A0A919VLR8_9CLOT|nr:alpha-glucosidase [Clostridium polyendosporum]GIM28863.1 alpha-amylase [Clostridium polyendosporum]
MNRIWWKEAVVYQIYPKSFYDSNNDGIGDIKGITKKLPYLKDLGVDVVWICPFYKSPMKDNGYDVADYYAIDPMFGTMDDMDELLENAREYNIKILIDLVLNHSSSEHKWFQEAISDSSSSYRDYYIFKNLDGEKLPTNWRSIFGGSVWERSEDNNCYMHVFDKSQPDLNWENPKLREELYEMINYWLDKGVAGFRLDAITFIKKDQNYPCLPTDGEDGLVGLGSVCLNQKGIGVFLKELKEKTYGRMEAMTVAEAPGVPYEQLDEYIGDDGHFSMIFDFSYSDLDLSPDGNWYPQTDWSVKDLKEAIFHSQLSIQDVGWGALYLENHDQPRSIDKYFRDEDCNNKELSFYLGSVLATMYFLLRGTPFIYQGEEIGMRNCPFSSIDEYNDVSSKDQFERAICAGITPEEALKVVYRRSRDNGRTPMQWSDCENGGFTHGKPWLKVNPNYREINVKNQINDENSLYQYYKKLIKLRKSISYKDVIVYGAIEPALKEYDNIVAYSRKLNDIEITVITNLSSKQYNIPIEYKENVLSNYMDIDYNQSKKEITLRPYEAVVLVK